MLRRSKAPSFGQVGSALLIGVALFALGLWRRSRGGLQAIPRGNMRADLLGLAIGRRWASTHAAGEAGDPRYRQHVHRHNS